jgi:hypothetical protein
MVVQIRNWLVSGVGDFLHLCFIYFVEEICNDP